MRDAPPIRALCIPGIQNTREDWIDLENELSDVVELHHVSRPFFETDISAEQWEDAIVGYESEAIRTGAYELLIAHSHGAHRAGRLLYQNPEVKGAVLMNPPGNTKENLPPGKKAMHGPRSFHGNTMMNLCMNSLTLEMNDRLYGDFITRHADAFQKEEVEISRQLKILKMSPSFSDRQLEIPLDKQILLLYSKGDPWNPPVIHSGENQIVMDLGLGMGHYPHVSSPAEVAGLIRLWVTTTLHADAPQTSWYDQRLIPVE